MYLVALLNKDLIILFQSLNNTNSCPLSLTANHMLQNKSFYFDQSYGVVVHLSSNYK